MEKDGACKMDRQNKKCSCVRKSGKRKNNAGTDEEETKLAWPLAKKELLLKDPLERMLNRKKVCGRRRF